MAALKTFPLDLLGTAPSNKISGEVRTIRTNEDRIFIPTGGPFFTSSLKIWAGSTLLTNRQDYDAKELNRDATLASGKEVCNAIQIKHPGTTFTLEYRVIGGEYTELAYEISNFIKGTPINDLTKLDYASILYKPLTFPPAPHVHATTDWLGYGESIYILDQIRILAARGSTAMFNAIRTHAKNRIEDHIAEYIEINGVVTTDPTPSLNGNVLMIGNGKQPTPVAIDREAMFRELDERYFRNLINPLVRVGAVSDSFLPITTGFFNVTTPYIANYQTTAAAKVERNGDLLALTPATDGSIVRYVYGYVRGWKVENSLLGYKATNQQYRPPGLAPDEEIMQLFGVTNQTMLAAIYTVAAGGQVTFKEHAIVELNDTLLQDSHVLVRLGNALLRAIPAANANNIWSYRPSVARLRDGTYRIVSLVGTTEQGAIRLHVLNADKTVTRIDNWAAKKELRRVEHIADSPDRLISKTNTTISNLEVGKIKPFHWVKSDAPPGEEWIIDDTLATSGYTYGSTHYNDDMVVQVRGDAIHCHLSFANRVALYQNGNWRQNRDAFAGASYRIEPKASTPTYYWLRTKADVEEPSAYLTNTDQGFYRQLTDNPNAFEYRVPYDMTGGPNDVSAYRRSSQVRLTDGRDIYWRPRGSEGSVSAMQMNLYGSQIYDPQAMMNGYNVNRAFRMNGSLTQTIGASRFNLENPTVIPIDVGAIPMNSNLILLQTGQGYYGGGTRSVNLYAYKPSTTLVDYPTMELGLVRGFKTSDDRKLIASGVEPITFVNSRLSNGTCRYSSMIFQRKEPFVEETVYRSIVLDYNAGTLVKTQPYYLKQAGRDQIEFAINSIMAGDRNATYTSWALIISPEDPTVAIFDCMASRSNNRDYKVIRCAAKLTWNGSNELTGFEIRPESNQIVDGVLTITGVADPDAYRWYTNWGIQYNAAKTEMHWHGRHLTALIYPGNVNGSSAIFSYRMTYGADGFPVLSRYHVSSRYEGRKMIVTTPRGVGITWDNLAFGVYRIFQPFLDFNYVSGLAWSTQASDSFVYYTPRPTVSFKLRVTEDIDVQLGGVYSKVPLGVYELTDPVYSSVIDPRNKTIFVYVTLELGLAKLQFTEVAIPETTYTVYIGKCITDEFGILEATILPSSRIGNYRASAQPQGGAFSVSSGTANINQLLNWDADSPALGTDEGAGTAPPPVTPYMTVVGPNSVNITESIALSYNISPTGYQVNTVQWTSSNTDVATVDSSGRVTGTGVGNVDIVCRINGTLTASKTLAVSDNNVVVTINGDSIVNVTESKTYTTTVTPANYPVSGVGTWSSSDTSKLTVSGGATATVTGIRPGQVTLTKTLNGTKTGTKVITVSDSQVSVVISGTDTIEVTELDSLWYTINYPNLVIDTVVWSSSNPSAVSITQDGLIAGQSQGTSLITCTINGRYQATKQVQCIPRFVQTVINLADHGTFVSDSGYAISKNQTFNLRAIFEAVRGRAPNDTDDVTFQLPSGYGIVAPSTGTYAITLGAWPADTTYRPKLSNAGLILGRGGRGANTDGNLFGFLDAGEDGGRVIHVEQNTLEIINSGTIASGGGGGASGRGSVSTGGGGGGAPFGPAGSGYRGSPATAATLLNPGYGAGAGSGAKGGDGGNWGSDGQPGTGSTTQGRAGIVVTGSYIITNIGNGVIKGR